MTSTATTTTEPNSDGKGPRWVGDNLPDLPAALQHAQSLPPKVTDEYVFFFGFEGPEPECCLQQWFPAPFHEHPPGYHDEHPPIAEGGVPMEARFFRTSEQYMMFHKAVLMGDEEVAGRILEAAGPGEAKALGREVRNFDQSKWTANCDRIVEQAQYLKFSQNPELKKILLGTGNRTLVETSPNDRFWGIGFDTERALDHVKEWGENRLGLALMRARDRVAKAEEEKRRRLS